MCVTAKLGILMDIIIVNCINMGTSCTLEEFKYVEYTSDAFYVLGKTVLLSMIKKTERIDKAIIFTFNRNVIAIRSGSISQTGFQ